MTLVVEERELDGWYRQSLSLSLYSLFFSCPEIIGHTAA